MGIETAAILTAAGEAAATGAAVGAGAAGATAAGLGAGAAGAATSGIAAGSLEAANLVGAMGGDALGAFISANQGFGTMTAAESAMGMMSAVQDSKLVQGLSKASAAADQGQEQPAQLPAPSTGPGTPARPNQNPGLTQASGLMQSAQGASNPADLGVLGFADGGQVPSNALQELLSSNIFTRTRDRREQEAGLQSQPQPQGGVTINIGNTGDAKQTGSVPRTEAQTPSMGDLATSILQLIKAGAGYADGGTVRSGASDVKAGGEIRGKESKTGKDNQIIAVAGGEGILPKDVMEVPGVADMVQALIQKYHTPIRS